MKFSFYILILIFAETLCAQSAEIDVGQPRIERSDSVSVIGEKDIERAYAQSADDVLRAIPGIAVVRSGGPGQPSFIYIRGGDSEGTLVLLDGMPLNDPSLNNKAFDFSVLSLDAVERVEVWKGPQSVHFGSGATGGVINIITKKGQGPAKFTLGAEGGSYDTYKSTAVAQGSSGPVSYTVSANHTQSAGISTADKELGSTESDGTWINALATRLGWQLDPANDLEFSARFSDRYADIDYSAMDTAPFVYADDPNSRSRGKSLALSLGGRHAWTSQIASQLKVMRFAQTRDYNNDPDSGNPSWQQSHYSGEAYRLENTNSWHPKSGLDVEAGPSADFENASSDYHSSSFNGSFPRENSALIGGFARAQIDRQYFFGAAGARLDSHTRFGSQAAFEASPGIHLTSDFDVMFRYATAYKAPTLFELYDPQSGNESLESEHVRGYELALTKFLDSRRARFQLSFFENEYRDLIQFTNNKYANIGSAKAEGIELEGRKDFGRFELQFGYTYLETRDDRTGQSLLRRPRNNLTARAEVRPSDTTSASLDFVSADHREDISPVTSNRTNVASFQVLNGTLEWRPLPSLKLYARVLNLLDAKYEESDGYGTYRRSLFVGAIYGL